ncbi:hypothetical protein [Priestia sp. SB1]
MRPRRSASNEEAHRPPAESEAMHGNQQQCNKPPILVHVFNFIVFKLY